MPSSSEQVYSSRSRSVFADLVASIEDGEELDVERACGAHPEIGQELRALYSNWARLNGVLDRLATDHARESDLGANEPRQSSALQVETRRTLEQLSSPDRSFSRYETKAEIARGGMGVVLRVHDTALERDLAMKLVRDPGPRARGSGWRRLARFLSEARLAGKLDHPGIVPIHDVGVDAQGRAFFTMPLVRGRKLTEVIDLVHARREGWTQARALEAVLKVCDTVAYAHSVGVVHRDLKPDNIMIGRFGETYVMDWGLARVLEQDSRSEVAEVQHPETAANDRDAAAANDHDAAAADDRDRAAANDRDRAAANDRDAAAAESADSTAANDRDGTLTHDRADTTTKYRVRGDRFEPDEATSLRAVDEAIERDGDRRPRAIDMNPTRDGDVLGTPAYMAPEQAGAERSEPSPQADIYSVGAILYHLLGGRAPFSVPQGAPEGRDVLDALRDGPPIPVALIAPEAPSELVAICGKAMARSRDRRYTDMRAMSEDLRAYMDGRVVQAHQSGAAVELRKWIARNKRLSLAVASAIVLALGGLTAVTLVQTSSKNEILKLSDVRRIETLEHQADALWPAAPEKIGAMEGWLAEVGPVLENRALHQRTWSEMRERMRHASASDSASKSPASADSAAHSPASADSAAHSPASADSALQPAASNEDQWRFENQSRLVAGLDRLADPDPHRGVVANVRMRLADAQTLRGRSIEHPAAEWKAAIESIANVAECPLYRGLKITPQLGLTPIGRDPRTKLWEFAHLASGAPAERAADGHLVIDEGMGIVLVLIPGGTSSIGSQPPKPLQPSDSATDPLARSEEQPAHTVDVAPFFLSKYELSRSQWDRWCAYARSTAIEGAHASDSPSHPARGMSWFEATRELAHMGLLLPTEAQWEYAARAGTSTRWWCGNEPRFLIDAANLGSGIDGSLPYSDAFEETAPIDALRPNPWGLHNVHGNVSEWTRDVYWPKHDVKLRDADGLVLAAENGLRTARGGSYKSSAANARSASRSGVAPENHDAEIGVRAARGLDP